MRLVKYQEGDSLPHTSIACAAITLLFTELTTETATTWLHLLLFIGWLYQAVGNCRKSSSSAVSCAPSREKWVSCMGGTHVLSVDALVHSACSSVYFCASILCHLTNVSALSRNLLGYHLDGIIGHSSFSWSLHNYSLLSFISLFFLSYCLLSLHPFSLSLSLSPPVFEEGVGFKFLPGPSGLMQLNLAQR